MSGKKVRLKTTGRPTHHPAPQRNLTATLLAAFAFLVALGAMVGVGWLLRQYNAEIHSQTKRLAIQQENLDAENTAALADLQAEATRLDDSIATSKAHVATLEATLAERQPAVSRIKREQAAMADAQSAAERLQAMATKEGLKSIDPAYLTDELGQLTAAQETLEKELKRAQTIAAIRNRPKTPPRADAGASGEPPVQAEPPIEGRHVKIDFRDEEKEKRIELLDDEIPDPMEVTVSGRWIVSNSDFRRDWSGLSLHIFLIGESVVDKSVMTVLKRYEVDKIAVKRSNKADGTVGPAVWRYTRDGKLGDGAKYEGWILALYDSSDRLVTFLGSRPSLSRIAEKVILLEENRSFDAHGDTKW